jgi:hypothetical protein
VLEHKEVMDYDDANNGLQWLDIQDELPDEPVLTGTLDNCVSRLLTGDYDEQRGDDNGRIDVDCDISPWKRDNIRREGMLSQGVSPSDITSSDAISYALANISDRSSLSSASSAGPFVSFSDENGLNETEADKVLVRPSTFFKNFMSSVPTFRGQEPVVNQIVTDVWMTIHIRCDAFQELDRILTLGYNACGRSGSVASPYTFVDHVLRLLAELTNNRVASGASSHPLVFMTRGLSGLICKYAMIFSHTSRSDLAGGVCQSLERIIHLGAPSDTEVKIGFVKASLRTPRLIDHVMTDKVQTLFNSLFSTQNGEEKETYIPFDLEMQSTQVSHLVNSTDSARLHMCNNCPSYGKRIDTTSLSEARDAAIHRLLTELGVLICKILCCCCHINAYHV